MKVGDLVSWDGFAYLTESASGWKSWSVGNNVPTCGVLLGENRTTCGNPLAILWIPEMGVIREVRRETVVPL